MLDEGYTAGSWLIRYPYCYKMDSKTSASLITLLAFLLLQLNIKKEKKTFA